MEIAPEQTPETISLNKRIRQVAWVILGALIVFFIGFGSGYLTWGQDETAELKQQKQLTALYEQVNPKEGYTLPISYGDLGPQ
jgi:hypothetical protein